MNHPNVACKAADVRGAADCIFVSGSIGAQYRIRRITHDTAHVLAARHVPLVLAVFNAFYTLGITNDATSLFAYHTARDGRTASHFGKDRNTLYLTKHTADARGANDLTRARALGDRNRSGRRVKISDKTADANVFTSDVYASVYVTVLDVALGESRKASEGFLLAPRLRRAS